MEDEMKPCLFCGVQPVARHDKYYGEWDVACRNDDCGMVVETDYFGSEAEANAAWNKWNTRPGEERAAREAVAAFAVRLMAKVEERRKAAIMRSEQWLRGTHGEVDTNRRSEPVRLGATSHFATAAAVWDEISDLLKEEANDAI